MISILVSLFLISDLPYFLSLYIIYYIGSTTLWIYEELKPLPQEVDEFNFTPEEIIHRLCYTGNLRMLRYHLSSITNATHQRFNATRNIIAFFNETPAIDTYSALYGFTPLILACKQNHKEITQLLISNGANIYKKSKNGMTSPIHEACRSGHSEIVEVLLSADEKSALLDLKVLNRTPYLCAVESGQLEVIKMLDKYDCKFREQTLQRHTGLHLSENVLVSKYILKKSKEQSAFEVGTVEYEDDFRAFVNQRDSFGDSALCVAAASGNYELSNVLLQNGASVSVYGIRSPLHIASKLGRADLCALFLEYGADVHLLDFQSRPAIWYSLRSTSPSFKEVVNVLLSNHSRLLYNGECMVEDPDELAKICLEFPRSAILADSEGSTLLHHACSIGSKQLVQVLIESGSDLRLKNAQGTGLHIATASMHFEIAGIILERDANVANVELTNILPIQKLVGLHMTLLDYDPFKQYLRMISEATRNKKAVCEGLEYVYFQEKSRSRNDVDSELLRLILEVIDGILYHDCEWVRNDDCSVWIESLKKQRNMILFDWILRVTDSFGGVLGRDLRIYIFRFM